jgi:hypothetical protein
MIGFGLPGLAFKTKKLMPIEQQLNTIPRIFSNHAARASRSSRRHWLISPGIDPLKTSVYAPPSDSAGRLGSGASFDGRRMGPTSNSPPDDIAGLNMSDRNPSPAPDLKMSMCRARFGDISQHEHVSVRIGHT